MSEQVASNVLPLRKRCLSLDLGITTGYAVLSFSLSDDPEITIEDHGVLGFDAYRSSLSLLLGKHKISYSVAEQPALTFRGQLGNQLQQVVLHTSQVLMRQVELVDPAQWKPTPFKKYPTPPRISPHERDAIRLGVWYIHTLLKRVAEKK